MEMAKAYVSWLNSLPPHSSLGNELSPRTIVTGQKLDFKRHCHFLFGEYVQTHEEHDNSMSRRMVGALALHPTGNAQGGFYFMSLSTGWVLNHVVDQVHRMARQQKVNPGLLFGNRSMSLLNNQDMGESSDDEDNKEYIPDDEDVDEGQNAGDKDASHDYNYDDIGSIESKYNDPMDADAIGTGDMGMTTHAEVNLGRSDDEVGVDEPENPGVDDAVSNDNTEMNGVENQGVVEHDNDIINQEEDDVECPEEKEDIESTEGENVGIAQGCSEAESETGYNLQGNRERFYKHLYDPEVFNTGKSNDDEQVEVMMTTTDDTPKETAQMSMKKGLKIFGEQGYATVKKETQQPNDSKVMQPIN